MTDTSTTIIEGALYYLGVCAESQPIPAEYIQRGLSVLNDILDEWGGSQVYIPYQTSVSLTLTINKESYTVGNDSSYDLNANQIIDILECVINDPISPGIDYQTIPMTEQMYANIPYKNASGIPSQHLLRNFPAYSEIRFQVLPYSTLTAKMLVKQRLSRVLIGQSMSAIPNHYIYAMKMALKRRIAPMFGKSLSPDELQDIQTALNNLLSSNIGVDWGVKRDEQLRRYALLPYTGYVI